MSLQLNEDRTKVRRKTPVRYLTEEEVDARTVYVVRFKRLCIIICLSLSDSLEQARTACVIRFNFFVFVCYCQITIFFHELIPSFFCMHTVLFIVLVTFVTL